MEEKITFLKSVAKVTKKKDLSRIYGNFKYL
jgi:hypothetical protein